MVRWCVVIALVVAAGPAQAGVRGTVRFGVLPLELESSGDTPLFGADIDRAVDAYNTAAAAYDRAHGATTPPIAAADLGVSDTLITIAPGLELGGGPWFVRLEAPLGFGRELRSIGLAIYPINIQARIGARVAVYGSAGGTASRLDRQGSGDVGGLIAARAAAGIRLSHLVIELGYNAFVLGGTVDAKQLDEMSTIARDAPPPRPDAAISAGEARGVLDLSVGVAF